MVFGRLFEAISEQAGKMRERHDDYYDKYSNCSDEQLLRRARNCSGIIEKTAIAKILKERGYNANDLK